jgi:hypothetical protein
MKKYLAILLLLLFYLSNAHAQECTINAGGEQTICVGAPLELKGNSGGSFINGTLAWSVVSQPAGAAVTIASPNSLSTTAGNATVAGTYVFRISVECNGVLTSNDVTYTVNAAPATPTLAAANTTYSCYAGEAIEISGTEPAAGESVSWLISNGSGTFSAPNSSRTTFTPNFPLNECGASYSVEIAYMISNASGCNRLVRRTYYFNRQYPFSATADPLNVCGSYVQLKGSCPSNGTALWSVESTPSGAPVPVFGNASSRNTIASNLVSGNYTFRYTVSGSNCSNGTGTVNVFVASGTAVSMAEAGKDQTFCSNPGTISLSGSTTAVGEGSTWSLLSGGTPVNITNPGSANTTVSGLTAEGAPYHFVYKVSAPGGCSTSDTVSVYVLRELALSGLVHTTCESRYLPSSGGGAGSINRSAQLGNFGYGEIEELTVTTTYISGPTPTIENRTSIGTSSTININSNSPTNTIALGQSVTETFRNTGDNNAMYELYLTPASALADQKSLTYYVVNNSSYTLVGQYKYRVTYTTKCRTYVAEVIVNRGTNVSINAGSDMFLNCGATSATLAGNVIDNFATWQTISMPAGATNPINATNHQLKNSPISGLLNGTYIFRYSNNAGANCSQNQDDIKVVVSNIAPPTPNAGVDQTVCAGSFTLNGSAIPANALGEWSVVSPAGSAVTFSNAALANPTVSGMLPNTIYNFRYTLINGCGSSFDDVSITTNSNISPAKPTISIPNGDCWVNKTYGYPMVHSVRVTHPALTGGNTGVLTAIVTPASSGTAVETASTTTSKTIEINLSADAAVSFIWTVSSASCVGQVASDTVSTYYLLNKMNDLAGADQNLCSISSFPYVVSLNGIATEIPKSWTLVYSSNGQDVSFGDMSASNTTVTLPEEGTYRFKYEIAGTDPACSVSDYVTIVASQPGALAQAGQDRVVCIKSGSFNLGAIPLATGSGQWEVVNVLSGETPIIENSTSATSKITFTRSGQVVLRWSSYGSNTVCGPSSSDEVSLTYIAPANAGTDVSLCNSTSTNLNAVNTTPVTGTWSQVSGPNTALIASPTNPNSLISGLVSGSYTFRWAVSEPCLSTDDVVITISNMSAVSNAGTDFTECNANGINTILMNATPAPTGLTGTWTVSRVPNGAIAGTFSNPSDPNAIYTGATVAGSYVFTWTLLDGTCSSTDFVTVTFNPESCITISGTVFNDANGNTLIDGSDASLSIPANMYVYLVNASGIIVDVVNLGTENTYTFGAKPNTSYTIEISPVSYPLGTDVNVTSINNTSPTDWVTTGENGAGNTGAGDLIPDGTLSVVTQAVDITQQNFGIEKKPVVYSAVDINRFNPGGTITSPVTSTLFTGDDKEDGNYPNNLIGREVTLSPATNGTLYYDGIQVISTLVITNFDPKKVSIDPDATSSTTGLTGLWPDPIFTYTVKDEAGVVSEPATIRVPFDTSLPVTLVSFSARKNENSSQLMWNTTEESNSDRFEVQQSSDANNWNTVGTIEAKGESKTVELYRFVDTAPKVGVNYYRLKMIDKDETFAFSHIVSLHFEVDQKISVYPNPVSKVMKFRSGVGLSIQSVEIFNLSGMSVYKNMNVVAYVFDSGIDVSQLPNGIYLVNISTVDGMITTNKIVVTH